MRKTRTLGIAFLVGTLLPGACYSQTEAAPAPPTAEPRYFRLEFVIKEVEAEKVINARAYSLKAPTDPKGRSSIRTGNKVPYEVKTGEFQYADIGVNIDCYFLREVQNQLTMEISVDVSSLVGDTQASRQPLIRQNKWSSRVTVPIGKPTVLFSSDDMSSKRQVQFELTATPIK